LDVAGLPVNEAADRLVKMALERGAPDNVTVIVAKIIRANDLRDETLADSPYDETIRDEVDPVTAKIPAVTEPGPQASDQRAAGGEKEQPGDTAPAAPETRQLGSASNEQPPVPETQSRSGLLKWMLIFVIVLGGAAGAWFYWNHHQGMTASTSSPPPH
jgi:hypothetical protein